MAEPLARVCHVTTVHHADDHRILWKECVSLQAAGYDVTLIAPATHDLEIAGVKVVALPPSSSNRARRMLARPLAAFRAALDLDAALYHFHDPEFLPHALRLARRGKPVIYDVHEDLPKQLLTKPWISPALRRPAAWCANRVELAAVQRLSAVICSEPPYVERLSPHARRAVLVANFPRLEEISPGPWEERARAACYIGDLSRIRGLIELVDAMSDVAGHLELAGSFDSSLGRQDLEASPGWQRVRFHGRIGRPEIAALLRRCRVGVVPLHAVPNYVVAWPVKLFEYMAAGLPVVATDVPPWNGIIARFRCGICVPVSDSRALAAAITRLFDDADEAREMGERGRRAVEQHYSWTSQEANLLGLYEELLR
ncbi:MAG TPA: glycosyltransferase family 4 protein [Gaiellales bacterium]|nr:glycosyltransferase family 4 protein [Gaiellales bacterium]